MLASPKYKTLDVQLSMEIDSVKWKWNNKHIFSVYVESASDHLTSDDEGLSYKHI
jgi:hypothetical protein